MKEWRTYKRGLCGQGLPLTETDRKLDASEETLNLYSHVVDQKLGDEKVAKRLADEVVGQDSPVLSS